MIGNRTNVCPLHINQMNWPFNKEGHYSYAVFEKHVESGTEKATLMDCDRQH